MPLGVESGKGREQESTNRQTDTQIHACACVCSQCLSYGWSLLLEGLSGTSQVCPVCCSNQGLAWSGEVRTQCKLFPFSGDCGSGELRDAAKQSLGSAAVASLSPEGQR